MNYIPRVADREILAFIEDGQANKNVLLVEGARQVGKSFLVEHALTDSC
jgi:predicted AAA+ superfamily ATPase